MAQQPAHASGSTPTTRTVRKVLPLLLLGVGVVIFILGFALTNTGDDTGPAVTQNANIEALIPAPDSEVLRQSQVGIDLVSGFRAELTINGTPIPPDEVNVLRDFDDPEQSSGQPGVFDETLSQFLYQPLEGRAVPELKGDENCVEAQFWPIADPSNIDTVEWCFTVA